MAYPRRQAQENFENLFLGGELYDDDDDDGESDELNNTIRNEPSCWIFGYGSLCWNPGFEFTKCITGYIRGYVRRFWQGNTAHRGTEERPGRVATLVEDRDGITWGCAYRITGSTALEYLKQREVTLGGYITAETKFFPRIASNDSDLTGEAIMVLAYIATEHNKHWLGYDTPQNIATQIVETSGPSGHNIEYLLRLSNFMHNEIPDAVDEHLFHLEKLVYDLIAKRKIHLLSVMGDDPQAITRDSHEETKRTFSFEYTSRIADRKLRCLNI